ncbi:MAG: imidazoleglycerol-phosphate dehydratase HisB [Victivallaceae bacterium]|nr:imidazoleglycerol-phosphate dehydratase HisB [Victivallaceae bacterium]
MPRTATIERNTRETQISLTINLDGSGKAKIDCPVKFMTHMLELFARHGLFDLECKINGDTDVDYHHTMEDLGLVLGEAIAKACGDKRGIRRYGSMILPMDETLVLAALDLSGRPYLVYNVVPPAACVKDIDVCLFHEFFQALSVKAGMNLHFRMFESGEAHHLFEAMFKAFARALDEATGFDPRIEGQLPSTKGVL